MRQTMIPSIWYSRAASNSRYQAVRCLRSVVAGADAGIEGDVHGKSRLFCLSTFLPIGRTQIKTPLPEAV